MITLITGTPGAGKTLRCLWLVEALRISSGRDVYYSGIADLNLPWFEFSDATKWYELPDKAIIVIDECQRVFRPRAPSVKVPPHVEALETHRHRGIDMFLVTQHPSLVELNVRRLVELHEHLMRKFGSAWATVHGWKGVKDNCDKSRSDSIRSEFKYPKHVYTWYKSAELHTAKFKLPGKVIVLLALPLVLAAAVYFAASKLSTVGKSQLPLTTQNNSSPSSLAVNTKIDTSRSISSEQYLDQYKPRFAGLPWTAPRYDDLTQPVTVPVIRGCVDLGQDAPKDRPSAWCQLDGGVFIYPPKSFITQYIRDRYFIDFERTGRAGDIAASQPRQGDQATGQQRPPVPLQN